MATYSAQCSAVGSFNYASYFKLYVELTETEVSIANNTSKVKYNVYCQSSGSGSINANHYLYFNINGSDKRNETIKVNVSSPNAYIAIASGTTDAITHNNDGTKSITFSAQIKASSYGVSASTSGTFTLSTIARASSVAGGSGNIAGTSTITVTRASSSFTHTLRYTFGSLSETIATGVGTSYNWTLPTSFYAQIPNAKSGTGTIYCDTYNGGTLIGTTSTTFTATVTEASSRPTVTATLTDTNATTKALTGNASKMVKGESTGQLVITSTVKNSATIKSVTINGVSAGTAASITKTYANISISSFTIVTTDSRGFTNTSYVLTPSYVNYVPLTLNLTIFRPQPTGTEVQMTYSGNYFNASFGSVANTLSITWKYKVKGASSWTNGGTITPTLSGNTISSKTISLGTSYNYQTAYEFQITAVDKLTNSVQTMSLSVGLPVFDWSKEFLRVNKKLLLKDSPPNFGGTRVNTVANSYVKLFSFKMTMPYKNTSIWFTLCDTQATNENLLCNLYARMGSETDGVSVTNFRYIKTTSSFSADRLVAVVTSLNTIDVYFKMNSNDSPAITILSMTRLYDDNDEFGKITIDCNTTVTSLPSGNKTNPSPCVLHVTGGTLSGPLNIQGTAASIPLMVRGIVGSDGTSTVGELHLQYGANAPIKLGNTAAYNISADGSLYSGTAEKVHTYILYDNASGTGGSITLSQSAANFNYLEVIYSKWGKYYASTKVHSPNGKTVSLTDSYYDNSNAPNDSLHQILSTIISISGTSVTVLSGNTGLTNLNYNNQFGLFNNNELYIHRIIGYK